MVSDEFLVWESTHVALMNSHSMQNRQSTHRRSLLLECRHRDWNLTAKVVFRMAGANGVRQYRSDIDAIFRALRKLALARQPPTDQFASNRTAISLQPAKIGTADHNPIPWISPISVMI
jgi:hypothetical protein